jgi:hypothetical protein
LPGGEVGTAYSQTLAATGDTPITWSVESGALPGDLTLSSAGVISGTPTAAGAFNFTVKAANAAGSGTKQLSITITPVFTTIAEFKTWLDAQSDNTPETPYTVKLNVSDLGDVYTYGSLGNALYTTKYVNLDLSGSTVTSIGGSAFYRCDTLTGITIPNSVTSIGENAFAWCEGLTSVTIPNSVTGIGSEAFYGCNNLTAINVDPDNSAYTSENGVLYNKAKTLLHTYPAGKIGAFIIPTGVTSFGENAFAWCEGLTSVTIPNSVTSIGSYAFSTCTSLTSVTFETGSNITSGNFGSNAFPEGSEGYGGDTLKTAYNTGKAGTYTRAANGSTWTKL